MAVSVEAVMDCIGNPLKARVMLLMREFGPMTPKQILQEDPRIPPASLYRALKSMEKAEVIEMVAETKVRAVVERTFYFNKSLTERIEDVGRDDTESYCRLFMSFGLNLMRRFEEYAANGAADFSKDAVSFVSIPVYATPDQLREHMGKIMEIASSDDLYAQPMHPYTQALLSAAPIPDPKVERTRKRIVLEGDVPSPDKERHQCYFYDRCSKRMDKCACCQPPMFDCGNGHKVACFLYDDKPVAEPANDNPTPGELKLRAKEEKKAAKAAQK